MQFFTDTTLSFAFALLQPHFFLEDLEDFSINCVSPEDSFYFSVECKLSLYRVVFLYVGKQSFLNLAWSSNQ